MIFGYVDIMKVGAVIVIQGQHNGSEGQIVQISLIAINNAIRKGQLIGQYLPQCVH